MKDDLTDYKEALVWCEKRLLRQGPLEYFVHHNTLHSFEDEEFIDALFKAKTFFQANTHMKPKWFQEQRNEGRINQVDLEYAKDLHLGVEYPFSQILNWNDKYLPVDNPYRDLFLKEHFGPHNTDKSSLVKITTYWDFIKSTYQKKILRKSNDDLKFKFLSAFFDKGTCYWAMEEREQGLDYCARQFVNYLPNSDLKESLINAYAIIDQDNSSITQALKNFANVLELPQGLIQNYLFQVLNDSKGWTGLVYSLVENKNFNPTNIIIDKDDYIKFSLAFELAGYLLLSKRQELNPIFYNQIPDRDERDEILAYLYDMLIDNKKNNPEVQSLFILNKESIQKINLKMIIRVWQEAYEHHLYKNLIDAHSSVQVSSKKTPKLQVVTCIDDREGSLRRYFEEFDSQIETFGYAGHFGLNIFYRSLRDAHYRALCPVNIVPTKYVFEELLPGQKLNFKKWAKLKNTLYHSTNLPLTGALLSFFIGPLTGILFLFERFSPQKIHSLRKRIKKAMFPQVSTQLNYGDRSKSDLEGFSNQELANAAESMIMITGLNKSFAELVFLCGHGSKSMNNPHGAAYNCGACAGGKGAPNARLMAAALNKKEVRELLKERDIIIPQETIFIGGYHCTSTSKILSFDTEHLSAEQSQFLKASFLYAKEHDSKERLRKFNDVSLKASYKKALSAAENRSYDFSQPRPEYGHNTNVFCHVGPRQSTSSLFFDRRAFLVSYEADNDPTGNNLSSLLSAVIPVCAGINLEYYFSYVDQEKFGAGVKQAHNVTAMSGVINGYQSDLQMGLPWQMVEIHEPARIIFLIEADQKTFEQTLAQNKEVRQLVENEWVRIILKDKNRPYMIYGKDSPKVFNPSPIDYKPYMEKSDEIIKEKRGLIEICLKGNQS